MQKLEKAGLAVTFLVAIVGVIISHLDHDFFRDVYTVEDGVLETCTFFFLAIGAIVCFKRIWELKGQRHWWFLFCTLFLGLIFTFGAGEEISWGQRIFNIESSEFFQSRNAQLETNLHNLTYVNDEGEIVKINKLVFGKILTLVVVLYLLLLPFLYRKKEKMKSLINAFAIPIARNRYILAYIGLFLVTTLCTSHKKGELLEFGGSLIFILLIMYPLNTEAFDKTKKL